MGESKYKVEFKNLVEKHIQRDGIEEIMNILENTDFYTAPASTRYHGSEPEGLVKHSIAVFNRLVEKAHKDYSMETIALVALFHDLCKMGFYDVEMRNRKNEKGQWEKYPFYIVNDLFPMGHGEKSVILLMQEMKLEPWEMMAIRWHMGGFEPKENYNALSKALGEYPLVLMLQQADMEATYWDGV